MELVTRRTQTRKTILDVMVKVMKETKYVAGKESHRRYFLSIEWSQKVSQGVTYKVR